MSKSGEVRGNILTSKRFIRHRQQLQFGEVPPIQNQWYTPINLSNGVIIKMLYLQQQNDEVAAKNLEAEITIDGDIYAVPLNAIASGDYFSLRIEQPEDTITLGVANAQEMFQIIPIQPLMTTWFGIPFECYNFSMRYRITSALGTNQIIGGILSYSN